MEQPAIRFVLPLEDDEKKIEFAYDPVKDMYISDDKGLKIQVEAQKKGIGLRYLMRYAAEFYKEYESMILGLFESKYEEKRKEQQESYESGFEYDDEDDEDEGIKVPYDPQLITVAPAKFSLKEIISMVDGEDDEETVLDLAPAFQREYVWDNGRKSRLIESILLNIPLPMFYLSRDKNGKLQVVDGLQRLTTIYKFFKNEFKLTKLEYLKEECDGKYFKNTKLPEEKSLRPKLVRALRQYQIDCNVIEPSTPENVKLDIFKRLNTGGKELNKQEVRHAFMKKDVREFIKKMVDSEEFISATDRGINDKRMLAQELMLRYIGFYCIYIEDFLNVSYNSNMDDFLDMVAIELNNCKKIPYQRIYEQFTGSMNKAIIMFDDRAFRKIDVDVTGKVSPKKYPINKSLFIAFAIVLSRYSQDEIEERGSITQEFAEFLWGDDDFMYSISHNTNYQLGATIKRIDIFLDKLYSTSGENI